MEISSLSRCPEKNLVLPCNLRTRNWPNCYMVQFKMSGLTEGLCFRKFLCSSLASTQDFHERGLVLKRSSLPVDAEESSFMQSVDEETSLEDSSEDPLSRPLTSDELKSLLVDSERSKLVKKLSEANQQNRFLKRQLKIQEDDLVNLKSELAVMELEVQVLVTLAEEIANLGIPKGSRKINGKYIQSHLLSRLEAVREKLKKQIKDVEAVESKEVYVSWYGMAESVQVMGTFDGWSQGEDLSPEYTGSYTKFSTTLMLRPGRYEIKFLVDGEWQLSQDFPIIGEGMMENNVLIVE